MTAAAGTGTHHYGISVTPISKLNAGDSDYLFRPSIDDNGNGTILGWPVTINNDMDDIATTNKPVAFGDTSPAMSSGRSEN